MKHSTSHPRGRWISFLPPAGVLFLPWILFAETATIVDKWNEYNGCTVEVTYDEKDLTRERIDWIRSLHYFDHRWELRKAVDFYPHRIEGTGKDRAKRVILFDPAGKEQGVTYYNRHGDVLEQIDLE